MPLIPKPNYNQIFASQAPDQDKPAVFNNYPEGWGPESRPNNGKPTIKGFNYLQQTSDLKDLWVLQNGACLPYDESIEYAEGAPVLKDGVIQYKTASGFSPAISEKPYILKYFTEGVLYPLNARVMLENGDIVKSTIDGNTANPNTDMSGWKREDAKFTFFDFGFKHNTDCTAQLKTLANYAANNDLVIEDFSNETYFHSENISIVAPNRSLTINSNCKFAAATHGLKISGTIPRVGTLSADALKASSAITLVDAPLQGLQNGDIVVIHNTTSFSFSLHKSDYMDGEFNIVKSVSGNTITLKHQLQSLYEASKNIEVYKINPVILDIKGLVLETSAVHNFTANFAYKSKIDVESMNDGSNSASQAAIFIDRCLKTDITGGRYVKENIGGTGTDYGILIGNSQDINICADYAYGARHGVTTGGGNGAGCVPNRRILIKGVEIENDPSSSLHAADFHGNIADSSYENCLIWGRISLSGENVASIGNTINSHQGDVRSPIGLSEVVGGNIKSIGDTVNSSGAASYIQGWLSSLDIPSLSKKCTFELRDITFRANNNLVGISSVLNLPVENNQIIDGFELIGSAPVGFNRLMNYSAGGSTTKPSYIQITRPKYAVPESTIVISGEAALAGVKKNVFQASGSNANGSWTKFSDGTMICRHRVTTTLPINTAVAGGFKSADIPWTYPVAFISAPSITAMSFDNSSLSIRATSAGSSSAQLYSTSMVSIPSAGINFDVVAVGRWLRE